MGRKTKCLKCGKEFPLNETLTVKEECFCRDCADKNLKERENEYFSDDDIKWNNDPTVCVNCGFDNGENELPTLASLPTCAECENKFRNWPYPRWLKISLACLFIFLAFSFYKNFRFFKGYYYYIKARKTENKKPPAETASLFFAAAKAVPEDKGFKLIASFYHAMALLEKGKQKDALPLLKTYSLHCPKDIYVKDIISGIEMSLAFDEKNYEQFYAKNKELMKRHPKSSVIAESAASACACLYATTNDEKYKKECMQLLAESEKLLKKNEKSNFLEYKDRILYRLGTKNIISKEEFYKKYPDGWKRKKKEPKK